jgi:outer membrane protein
MRWPRFARHDRTHGGEAISLSRCRPIFLTLTLTLTLILILAFTARPGFAKEIKASDMSVGDEKAFEADEDEDDIETKRKTNLPVNNVKKDDSIPAPQPTILEPHVVQPENELTLQKSLDIALRNATNVLKASNDVDLSGTALLQAYGQFLPNVQAVGSYSFFGGRNYFTTAVPTLVNGNNYGINAQLTSTLNIFNGLSDYSNFRALLDRQDASKMTFFRAKQQVMIDVTQAFLQVLLDQHLVQIAEKNLSTSSERQRLLREQTRVGVRNLSDLFRQEAQTSSDESLVITKQNKLRTDQIGLLRRLRLDISQNYKYAETGVDFSPKVDEIPDENNLLKTALDKRADLKASVSTSEQTSWNVGVARAGYIPKIDLAAGVFSGSRYFNYQYVSGINYAPSNQPGFDNQLQNNIYYTVGITLTWNLFDRFQTGLNVQNAAVAASNAQIDLVDRKLQVEGEIRQTYVDYKAAVQQLETSRKGLQAAEKAYETVQARYEVGASSYLDLVTSQTALLQAQTSRIQSQIEYLLSRKSIDFFVGTMTRESVAAN